MRNYGGYFTSGKGHPFRFKQGKGSEMELDYNTFMGEAPPDSDGSWTRVESITGNNSTNNPRSGHTSNPWTATVWKKQAAPRPADPDQSAPTSAPAPTTPSMGGAGAGNPQLTIPGVDVRLSGENLGIKPAKSSSRKAGTTNRGTSRLTIPRSSGYNPLNI